MAKVEKKTIKAAILSNKMVAKDHFVMKIESRWLANKTKPGQFVSLKTRETGTDPLLRIPLGVHKIDKKGIWVLYRVIGEGTQILSLRKKDEKIDILGPLGNGFHLPAKKKKAEIAILISGGHGIAPLYALAEELKKKRTKILFYIGACEKKHILCEKELRKLGAEVHIATECGTVGHEGYITELVDRHLERATSNEQRATIYACGPRPMLGAVSHLAEKYRIKAQVSLDEYMACGIGACLGCAVGTKEGYKYVCKDGPVFCSEEILWDKDGGACGCNEK